LGYSVGIGFDQWDDTEKLRIEEGNMTVVEENMIFHMLPYIIIESWGSVCFSDTVVVGRDET